MKLEYMKATLAAVWIFLVCGAGLLGHATSITAWSALAVLAVLPPLALMLFWKDPEKTLSETIREAQQ